MGSNQISPTASNKLTVIQYVLISTDLIVGCIAISVVSLNKNLYKSDHLAELSYFSYILFQIQKILY